MVRFLLFLGVSCFFVSQEGLALLTVEELERVRITYKAWSEEMQDSPAQDGTSARAGNPHLHDKNLSLGLGDEGAILEASPLFSGGDFCRLCDKCFGINARDLRPFNDVLSDFRGAASGKGLEMLKHQDASNAISRALLPRVDWVNSRVYDTLSRGIIEGLQSSSGTTSACYNAFFIGLVTAILGKEEELRREQERRQRQTEDQELQQALARSRSQMTATAAAEVPWWKSVSLSEADQLAVLEAMDEVGAAAALPRRNALPEEESLAVVLARSLREF